jgi:hypothetical protein
VLLEFLVLSGKRLEVVVIAFDDALFEHDIDQILVPVVLVAAQLDHLPQKVLEALNVNLVVRDKALVANHFDEAAK